MIKKIHGERFRSLTKKEPRQEGDIPLQTQRGLQVFRKVTEAEKPKALRAYAQVVRIKGKGYIVAATIRAMKSDVPFGGKPLNSTIERVTITPGWEGAK